MFCRQPLRQFRGFLGGVAGKGVRVFDDFGRSGKIVERETVKILAEDGLDFADLVGVARGDEQRRHARSVAGSSKEASCSLPVLGHSSCRLLLNLVVRLPKTHDFSPENFWGRHDGNVAAVRELP